MITIEAVVEAEEATGHIDMLEIAIPVNTESHVRFLWNSRESHYVWIIL